LSKHHHHQDCKENHDHNHDHGHSTSHHHHSAFKDLRFAFFLNFIFTILEFIAGFYTNSMAILSDAVHDLGDTIAIGASLGLEKYSVKGRDGLFSYGYRRFSPFAALLNCVILLSGSIIIIINTIPRFWENQVIKLEYVVPVAILGVVFNGLGVFRLKKSPSLNNRAVMLHLMEDLLGWVAVLIGGVMMYFTGWTIIDSILSLLISTYILWNAFKNLKSVFTIFMQAVPRNVDFDQIKNSISEINNVVDVHDLHSWSLDGQYHVMTIHITVQSNISNLEIIEIKRLSTAIIRKYGVEHPTIAIDFEGEDCGYKIH
jgi:cobalt-zinc-cadmium efflux system protein